MSDENENLDVEDYTIPELMELLNIEKLEPSLIKEKTNTWQ